MPPSLAALPTTSSTSGIASNAARSSSAAQPVTRIRASGRRRRARRISWRVWRTASDVTAQLLTITHSPGGAARFTVGLTMPDAFWQDPSTADWTQTSVVSSNTYPVTSLNGSNAPVADGVVLVTGPANNPVVTDYTTSAYVKLNRTLAAGENWRVNCATWATRYGTGLTLGSPDTAGSNGDPYTESGGGNARFLRMVPSYVGSTRQIRLTVAGSAFTTATSLSVRARRKYLQ